MVDASKSDGDRFSILDVGSGPESLAAEAFASANPVIVRLDVDPVLNPDYVHDICQPLPPELVRTFDLVFCSHVLEHMERQQVIPAIKNMASAVKSGGELWVAVPSLEWAAEQILSGNPSPALQGVLYGSQSNEYQYHKSGFTLVNMRQLAEVAGLIVRKAYQASFGVGVGSEMYPVLQNILIAARHPDDIREEYIALGTE